MADIDLLPPRGVPVLALVDGTGIASNGSQTMLQLAQRGMRSVCAVDSTGVSVSGATMLQLAQRGIRAFCPVDELGVAQSGATADALRRAGIRPMVLLGANGLALTGSATMLTLAQRGLGYFCPVDEAGNATTMGAVILVTNTTVLESATIGTNVGVLSVAGGTGTYTFSLTDSAGGKFVCAGTNGVNLNVAGALDYETATSHNITVSATNGGTPITRTIVITVQNVVEDTTPNAFSFTDVTGAALSTLIESNAITVAGIDGPATMTITGGQYQINGGAWASTSTTVVATNTVKVRGTSSTLNLDPVNVVLTIGGVSDTFTITTLAGGGSLPAPVLVWTSANTVYDPVFTATFTAAVADILTLEIDDNSDFSSLFDSEPNTLDSAEVAAGTVTYVGITTLSPGVTYYARLKLQRGADSVYSNTVFQTMFIDTTAPTLTSPLGSQLATTTANLGVTTNEANGTLYYVVTTSSTAPTAAQVKAGQNNSGTAAMYAGSQAVTTTGAKTATATGVTAGARYAYYMHEDAATNQSTVSASSSWTQAAGGAEWTPTDFKTDPAAGYVTSKTFTAVNIGAASAGRHVIVGVANNSGGSSITLTCTINSGGGDVSATLVSYASSKIDGVNVGLFRLNVPTGTTASITITSSPTGQIQQCAIGVGTLTGVNATPVVATPGIYPASGGFPYATGSSITVPTGGIVIGVAGCSTQPGTPGWSNITTDASLTGVSGVTTTAITMGHGTTAGSIAPASIFDNFAQCVTLAAAWGP